MFNGILFQESLQDLVKGIRAHRRDEEEHVRSKIAEITEECRSSDKAKKTNAVLKLTHLQMMGHNITFASFHIVEVMSSPEFLSKRIGYLASAQSFSPTTDVLLLTTNQFKKDMTSIKMQDCSQALTCLAKIVTEELGRDLESDVSLLLSSPRPYIRKKALLVLYRLIMIHPDTLPAVSARFRDRLADKDTSVVCAAVTVTCELARASPRSFLSLAPALYQLLMNKDSNNWMLIKIVKLMGVLTPLEPRLGKKLVEPLTTLMRSTRAKSLLYECCSTVTLGLLSHPEAVELCTQRLGEFMNDKDQNLKYLGLLSLRRLIQARPQSALEHRDNIIDCLDDEDIGIRMRALEIVSEFATIRTLRDISRILIRKLRNACEDCAHLGADDVISDGFNFQDDLENPSFSSSVDREAPFRKSLAMELLKAGEFRRSSDSGKRGYEMLSTADDFAWYITTIITSLAEIPMLASDVKALIGEQLLELTSRVEALRPVSVKVSLSLLSLRLSTVESTEADTNSDSDNANATEQKTPDEENDSSNVQDMKETSKQIVNPATLKPVLSADLAGSTAWVVGEYGDLIGDHVNACKTLITFPRKYLDAPAQVRVLTACVKLLVCCKDEESSEIGNMVSLYAESLSSSNFAEVQERACFFMSLLAQNKSRREVLAPLFEGKLIPVDHRAQSRVPVDEDLDLDTPLLDTGKESLYSYLLKTIGSAAGDADVRDEDGDLFKEAVFASGTLSLDRIQNGASVLPTSAEQGTLLSSLPPAERNRQNPFYLTGPSSVAKNMDRPKVTEQERHSRDSPVVHETGALSSKTAVVIAEENPLGLDLSDEERRSDAKTPRDLRLQAAFEGAFEGAQSTTTKKKEKRKKKKRKEARSAAKKKLGGNSESKKQESNASLIDFEDSPTKNEATTSSPVVKKPLDLTESLLL